MKLALAIAFVDVSCSLLIERGGDDAAIDKLECLIVPDYKCCRVCYKVAIAVFFLCVDCERWVCSACSRGCDRCGLRWCPAAARFLAAPSALCCLIVARVTRPNKSVMDARLVNQALALVVRECCPAELLRQLQAQAEQIQAQSKQIQAQSKQIRTMNAAINMLEVHRTRQGACCRVCFVVFYSDGAISDRFCFCQRCWKRVCRNCAVGCAGCRRGWCPACNPIAAHGRCPECASKSGH